MKPGGAHQAAGGNHVAARASWELAQRILNDVQAHLAASLARKLAQRSTAEAG